MPLHLSFLWNFFLFSDLYHVYLLLCEGVLYLRQQYYTCAVELLLCINIKWIQRAHFLGMGTKLFTEYWSVMWGFLTMDSP